MTGLSITLPPTCPNTTWGRSSSNAPSTPNVSTVKIRAGDPLRSKVRVVCETCNNTWLSAIQDAAKPLLIPMFDGATCVLGHEKQLTIATWISMATMTAEFLLHGKTQISVQQADRDWLRLNNRPPPDWRIWVGHYRR